MPFGTPTMQPGHRMERDEDKRPEVSLLLIRCPRHNRRLITGPTAFYVASVQPNNLRSLLPTILERGRVEGDGWMGKKGVGGCEMVQVRGV